MIYFDHAATTMPKPPEVAEAMTAALAECGNPMRGAHDASLSALRLVTRVRERVARMFGAHDSSLVAFTPNATYALNIAVNSIRGHIVSTAAEHNSVLRPLWRRGDFSLVPVDALGRLDLDRLESGISPRTGAVVVTHASNVTGTVYDLPAIAGICRRKGVRLVVDAAQTAGLLPVDMAALDIAALCFSGHKSLYGPQGIGCLCLAPDFAGEPLAVGGSGSDSFSSVHPSSMPDALEAGTHNTPGIAGLEAGMRYVESMGNACFDRADVLARRFMERVRALGTYHLYGDADARTRTPVAALNHRDLDAAELAFRLSREHGIAVRSGAHCAPLMHKALGTEQGGAVRFSFSHLNTEAEIDAAVEALAGMRGR